MQLKIDGELYYYQGIIDTYSRYIIAWDIHAEGTALNTGLVLQEAYDNSPCDIDPVVIADNGPEFIGKEFREVIKYTRARMCESQLTIHRAMGSMNVFTVHCVKKGWFITVT